MPMELLLVIVAFFVVRALFFGTGASSGGEGQHLHHHQHSAGSGARSDPYQDDPLFDRD